MALIRLENVSKNYGNRVALSDVTLSFDPGEWVFVMGPSGAGKSTLLRILALAERPSSGRIEVDPEALARRDDGHGPPAESAVPEDEAKEKPRRRPKRVPVRRVRRLIGVLGQEFRLLSDRNAYENIAIACQITGVWDRARIRERVNPLLDDMGIRGKEMLYPNDLSAGEKQRVALARAMARFPKILIADEPTGHLDPAAAAQIFALLRDICRHGTLVAIATHSEDWLRRYPARAIRLERGLLRSDQLEGAEA